MFDTLSQKILKPLRAFGRGGRINESDLKDVLKEIRMALLEADVHFKVAKEFLSKVEAQAVGQELVKSVTPGQQFVKIVHDALVEFLGGVSEAEPLDLKAAPPVPVLFVGLQGSGKTTSVAKLAGYLKNKEKKKVMVVPADNRRPAAKEQLRQMAARVGALCFDSDLSQSPPEICRAALLEAKRELVDVVIIDTAGRLSIDEELMQEVADVRVVVQPKQTLFVADAMTGQEAVNVVQAFHARTPITGVILSKLDGDARGGAALSIKYLTGIPILFVGMGEDADAIEPFRPERLAGRILDMGDVVSLVEKAQEAISPEEAMESMDRLKSGDFTLEDFLGQMNMMKKLGSMESILKMLPGGGKLMDQLQGMNPEKEMKQAEAIIRSMTLKERRNHKILNGSRRARIATGSGVQVADVNRLVKKYEEASKMFGMMAKSGMMKKMLRGGR